MCWACNPICGRCKPPQKHSVVCPECSNLAFFTRAEALGTEGHVCAACGADITEQVHVKPVHCRIAQAICAFPCKKYNDEPAGSPIECAYRTPVAPKDV